MTTTEGMPQKIMKTFLLGERETQGSNQMTDRLRGICKRPVTR